MDDKLEKFIKSHRKELDDKEPGKDLWEAIQHQVEVETKETRSIRSVVYWRAAAVFLLLACSWLIFDRINQPDNNQDKLAVINPQLQEAEGFYISLIQQKRNELIVMSEKYALGNDFILEIDRLDSLYSQLKQDLAKGNEENLVDAMVLNLQLRIELLNQQLSIIESLENSPKDESIIL